MGIKRRLVVIALSLEKYRSITVSVTHARYPSDIMAVLRSVSSALLVWTGNGSIWVIPEGVVDFL